MPQFRPLFLPPALALMLALFCALAPAQQGAFAQTIAAQPSLPPATGDSAQDAILVADRVSVEGRDILVAQGNVEAFFGTQRLRARKITYDRSQGQLVLEGPVVLTQGENSVLMADTAQLDTQFANGLLRGARMILDQQVQMAANRIDRVDGRYTQLYKASVTSCRICTDNSTPLWQIRARRVIHDNEEKQIYFEDAQIHLKGTPIFWLPRLRLPDPSLKRASGFLFPSTRQSSRLGAGVKTPYFFALSPHRDLTLTPYLTPQTRTLEWHYRQAFSSGEITFNGAFSDDRLKPDARGYLFGEGQFALPYDYQLAFKLKTTSDRTYMVDYAYGNEDRLPSEISLSRAKRDQFFQAELLSFQSLRDDETTTNTPTLQGDITLERRYFPTALGGELRTRVSMVGHHRYSDADIDGRDIRRANIGLDWHNSATLWGGMRGSLSFGIDVDSYLVDQDSTSISRDIVISPNATMALRWPLMKTAADGSLQTLEPVAALNLVGGSTPNVPNEESTLVEFDEGNLLALSRFPARDRVERDATLAYGVAWRRVAPGGWDTALTLGQVARRQDNTDFSNSSGLQGQWSDVLAAWQLRKDGFSFTGRTLWDGVDLTKAEARLGWATPKLEVGASYLWLMEDPAEARTKAISEVLLASSYQVARHWKTDANWRYDLFDDRTAEAGVGLEYRNECLRLNLSLSRRYTSSSIIEPSTEIGLTIGIEGFSARTETENFARTCRN